MLSFFEIQRTVNDGSYVEESLGVRRLLELLRPSLDRVRVHFDGLLLFVCIFSSVACTLSPVASTSSSLHASELSLRAS